LEKVQGRPAIKVGEAEDEVRPGTPTSDTVRSACRMEPRAQSSRQLSIISDALDLVLRDIARLTENDDVSALHEVAYECRRVLDGWTLAPPTAEER